MRRALDDVGAALWIVDADGRVMFENRTGESLMRHGRWVSYKNSCICPGDDIVDPAGFRSTLSHVIDRGVSSSVIERRSQGARAVLNSSPLTLDGRYLRKSAGAIAIVWLIPFDPAEDTVEVAARLFKLSPAEARLLALVTEGHDLPQSAELLGRSHHTTRMQLRSIFAKTGQHSQSGLCALVARLSAVGLDHRPTT